MLMRLKSLWLIAWALQSFAQTAPPASPRDQGREEFTRLCAVCHGAEGTGGDRGPSLVSNRRRRAGRPASEIHDIIRHGTPGGMPAFKLTDVQIDALTSFVRSLTSTAFENQPAGDVATGERFFFGDGLCASCHMVKGRGVAKGPDLSNIAKQLSLAELDRSLSSPSARIAEGYGLVDVHLKDGQHLRGFARNEGKHNLALQSLDGRLHLLVEGEYDAVTREKASLMPALNVSAEMRRDLLAYLSRLDGVKEGANPLAAAPVSDEEQDRVIHARRGEWPTYHGDIRGNRFSELNQITTENASRLQMQWSYSIPYFGLEMTPLVMDGLMIVTGPNQVYGLDARTGREVWRYIRPRTSSGIPSDAAMGANRGAAVLGERVFFATDDAHMICLNRLSGALMWDVNMPERPQRYGATSAPLVAGDLVIGGVAGADEGIRGFIAAYKATTGELVWRFWTVPRPGEPGSETWSDPAALDLGGGSTWLTGSYDPENGLLYWPTGNPFPDTVSDVRKGDNLYTDCVLAIELKTGELRWHFQFTPHDLHDWDAVQPPVLVDAPFHGRMRKLLLLANRSGFFYVLDRITGEFLLGQPFVKKLTWASGIGSDGRPMLLPNNAVGPQKTVTCPAVRGATNWYSTSYNPGTNLFYVMAVEDCGYYWDSPQGGFGWVEDPNDPGIKVLRAIDIETGKIAWEVPQTNGTEGNYSGVLSTAGGVVFYGETGGGFAAVDARDGRPLWHFETNQPWKASPMTYEINGRQYVAIASGASILSFALR
jgi:PQQ-dependent dehydrogenase (methanol/ethanol family)